MCQAGGTDGCSVGMWMVDSVHSRGVYSGPHNFSRHELGRVYEPTCVRATRLFEVAL